MNTYLLSKLTEQDLKNIYKKGVSEYGVKQAEKYLQSLQEKFITIAEMPRIYAERKELNPPVRICHHERHLIIYKINSDHIFIIRVLHDRMDYENLL